MSDVDLSYVRPRTWGRAAEPSVDSSYSRSNLWQTLEKVLDLIIIKSRFVTS